MTAEILFAVPFVRPPQNIVHSGSVARTDTSRRGGWEWSAGAGDAMTAAGRRASFNITKANFLSLPKRFATVGAGGPAGRTLDGRTCGKKMGRGRDAMEWGIDGKSLCPVAFPGRTKKEEADKKIVCANLFPFSRPSEQRRRNWFQMEHASERVARREFEFGSRLELR